jgi:hypothetical protein
MDFGDTGQGDQVQNPSRSAPKSEFEELLGDISQDLKRLEGDLADLRMESQALEKAGMYPRVATESWQPRNGKGSYLEMIFPRSTPRMRRKLYIGNKPAAIAEARRMNANRRRWEALEQAIIQLERFLRMIRCEVSRLADRVARYQPAMFPKEIASSLRSSQ